MINAEADSLVLNGMLICLKMPIFYRPKTVLCCRLDPKLFAGSRSGIINFGSGSDKHQFSVTKIKIFPMVRQVQNRNKKDQHPRRPGFLTFFADFPGLLDRFLKGQNFLVA